jgi:hypothetical protein
MRSVLLKLFNIIKKPENKGRAALNKINIAGRGRKMGAGNAFSAAPVPDFLHIRIFFAGIKHSKSILQTIPFLAP